MAGCARHGRRREQKDVVLDVACVREHQPPDARGSQLVGHDAAEPADHVQALAGSIEEAGSAARGFADALDALREAAP